MKSIEEYDIKKYTAGLSARELIVLILRTFGALDTKKVAERLGLSSRQVAVALFRAREHIRVARSFHKYDDPRFQEQELNPKKFKALQAIRCEDVLARDFEKVIFGRQTHGS